MPRILAIDYGIKKCGLAVTDPLQIIVSPLKTVKTSSLLSFLKMYFSEEEVEKVVMGMPSNLDGTPTYLVDYINKFCLLYTSPSPRDKRQSRMPSSA